MTTPGRLVATMMFTFSRKRLILTDSTPALPTRAMMYLRSSRSSFSQSAKCLSVNQVEFQSLTIPSRNPIGCVF